MADTKTIMTDVEGRMQRAIDHLEEELNNVRAGKASPNVLNGVMVDYYGSMTPVSGVASVTVPDAKTILIQPWDKKMIKPIEKAIIDSNIGLTPSNNGEQILLSIPPLTEERRKLLVKQIRQEAETARVSLRNARRDAVEAFKKAQKEGMPEDESKDGETQVQKLLEKFSKTLDAALDRKEREIIQFSDSESWERGVSNYWGNILFRRCLQTQSYRDMLDAAMKELYAYMNKTRIQSMLEHYRSVTETYVWQMPDRMYVPITHAEYEDVLKSIWPEIEENYNYYWESYRKPMPFYIGIPQVANGQLHLNWDSSYNFTVEDIYYTVELAKDYLFNKVLYRQENLILPELTMDTLPAGQYFLRVRATNASGYTQDAFDYYVTEAGKHYGMICFYVQPDGSIAEDTYEE